MKWYKLFIGCMGLLAILFAGIFAGVSAHVASLIDPSLSVKAMFSALIFSSPIWCSGVVALLLAFYSEEDN